MFPKPCLPLRSAWVAVLLCVCGSRAVWAQVIQGQVVDRLSNQPVRSGVVRLLDTRGEVASTRLDLNGRFVLEAPEPGRYWLRFESPGYRVVVSSAIDLAPGATLAYSIQTQSLPPAQMDTVVVEGRAVPARLASFYERRARGAGGEFFTREELDRWNPAEVTDIVRRAVGFAVVPNTNYGRRGDTRQNLVINNRLGDYIGQSCPPLVFLDGMYVGTAWDFDIDSHLAVTNIEAMEFYNGPGNMPIEFNRRGSDCGVIGIWTRVTTDVPHPLWRHIELGPQLGLRYSAAGLRDARIGGQVSIAVGPMEVQGSLNIIMALLGDGPAESRSGWQATGALRTRPLGRRSPWYLGAGATSMELNVPARQNPLFTESVQEQYFLLLAGATAALTRTLHPYIEAQVLAPFGSGRQLHLFTGIAFRAY
ncbi:hypothetical protein HRbin33_01628 [bacterium HR33]|nr:hypothetical protein HRbin33_01628 [bacterium HR33]